MEITAPLERNSKETETIKSRNSKIMINVRLSRNERRVATTKPSMKGCDLFFNDQIMLDEILKPTRHSSLNYGKNDKYTSFNYFLKKISRPQRDNHDKLQFIQRNVFEHSPREDLSQQDNQVNLVASPCSPTRFKIKTKSRELKAAAFQWVLTKEITSRNGLEKYNEDANINTDSYSVGEPTSVRNYLFTRKLV